MVMKVSQGEALGKLLLRIAGNQKKMFSLFIVSFHYIFANLQKTSELLHVKYVFTKTSTEYYFNTK